jgi:ankyrin repeat protein
MRQLLTDLRGNPIYFSARRRQRRYRHPNLPSLFYLVQNRSWDAVLRRAKSHRHEVTIQEDLSGNTPLHMACRLDPPHAVVRALISAAQTTNTEGATALHVAATHRCSADVIRVLLENDAATSCLTRTGRAPIHYACVSFRGLGVEAFRILLEETLQKGNVLVHEASPDFDDIDEEDDFATKDDDAPRESNMVNVMTMRDSTGHTPLGLLFRRYRERVRCVIKTITQLRTEHEGTMASIAAAITVQADLGELWVKARIIVGRLTEERLAREGIIANELQQQSPGEAAVAQDAAAWAAERHVTSLGMNPSNQATVGERHFRIVHASVGLTGYGCPPELIRLAISIHPQQVQEMDDDGNLPLHIAAVASSYTTNSNAEGSPSMTTFLSDEDSSVSDLSFLSSATCFTTNAFDKVIRILLSHYPAAARIPHGRTGRLPLVMAIEGRRRTWEDGIKTLLDAFPPALESRKISMTCYPAILTLIGNQDSFIEGFPNKTVPRRKPQGLTTLFEIVKAKPDLFREVSRLSAANVAI